MILSHINTQFTEAETSRKIPKKISTLKKKKKTLRKTITKMKR